MAIQFDILLKNGRIVDGSGKPSFKADIGIKDGTIKVIQPNLQPTSTTSVFDVKHQVVAPGFIDTHTHDDFLILFKPSADEKILQGVTSVVIGNCGSSLGPLDRDSDTYIKNWFARQGGTLQADDLFSINRLEDYLRHVEQAKPGINVIPLVGHGTLRLSVMGLEDRKCSPAELDQMKVTLREAMEDGAFGMSTGLIYPPGIYADTAELIELSKIVAALDGVYATHLRNEGNAVFEALDEAIQIGREAKIPVHISHHKVSGSKNWGKSQVTLDRMTKARENGQLISCDQYPYNAGATTLKTILPPGFLALGQDQWSRDLRSTEIRKKLRTEMMEADDRSWGSMLNQVGFSNILLSSASQHQEFLGFSLEQIAEKRGVSNFDALFDLLMIEKGQAAMIIFSMADEDIENILRDPYTMIGSDGDPDFRNNRPHPRLTGTFPRILGKFVRELGLLDLEEAVRKMTSLPASTFGIKQRGLIAVGSWADLVVFDPSTISDRSDYDFPKRSPVGISYVFVNGDLAVDHGRVIGEASGKVLRRRQLGKSRN